MQERIETIDEFVVARSEATKLLESVKESLDQVSRLVAMPVDRPLRLAVSAGQDDSLSTIGLDGVVQFIAVVPLVRNHGTGRDAVNQCTALRHVGDLSASEDQAQRISKRIDAGVNLGGPPDANKLRMWMHGAVYEREEAGQGSFLTEFRPCAVLFVRFEGIDYDADVAEKQLDTFLRQVQQIAEQYEGAVLQLTIGDKGSYLYANFGALTSHEDDARRAVKAALEIKNKSALHLQVGIAQGVMRVGAYGGQTRQTYGVLGDVVNLAARLMTSAAAGEILVSGPVHKATARTFLFEPRAALSLKGKTGPVAAFALISEQQHRAIRLQEPNYALPMVGRVQELEIIKAKLGLVLQGKSQVIGIIAEAGIGKSRLVAEVIRSARKKGFFGFGGACQSDRVNRPYQAWKSIWQAFFEVDHELPLKRQMYLLKGKIEDHAPERIQAMPLLNIVLDLQITDNDFTQMLEPKYRRSALHALLEDCLKTAGKNEPLLIVIEDLHWMDALSMDLLEELVRALGDSRVCFVLAYRPSQSIRLEAPRLEALPNFTRIELHEWTPPKPSKPSAPS